MHYKLDKPLHGTISTEKYQCTIEWRNGKFISDEPVATGKPSITWSQSVNEALCFGWIDSIRNSIDEESYSIRFTPRKPSSILLHGRCPHRPKRIDYIYISINQCRNISTIQDIVIRIPN